MNRGTTLLEVVLSIALLASLMIVLTSWTRLFGAVDGSAATVRWDVAAESVLQRIQEDILVGDFAPDDGPDARPVDVAARVRLVDGELLIATRRARRPGGSVLHVYGRALQGTALTVREQQERRGARPGVGVEPRVLLGNVVRFECTLEGEPLSLLVEIESDAGSRRRRRYRLP